jgi:hypothetical protein
MDSKLNGEENHMRQASLFFAVAAAALILVGIAGLVNSTNPAARASTQVIT